MRGKRGELGEKQPARFFLILCKHCFIIIIIVPFFKSNQSFFFVKQPSGVLSSSSRVRACGATAAARPHRAQESDAAVELVTGGERLDSGEVHLHHLFRHLGRRVHLLTNHVVGVQVEHI